MLSRSIIHVFIWKHYWNIKIVFRSTNQKVNFNLFIIFTLVHLFEISIQQKTCSKFFPSEFRDHSFRAYAKFSEKFTFLTSRQHLTSAVEKPGQCEICSKLPKRQNDAKDVVLMSLLLILNRLHSTFWSLHCWFWGIKYGLGS